MTEVMLVASALAQSSATPLTLHDAANIALGKNPLRKAALADTKAASAGVREAQSFLMPHVMFTELATRGDDPIYVFGSKLRQQRFTADNFAPPLNKLNTPLPYGNFSTRFGGTWNLFDSLASWRGINRVKEMNIAASRQLERTDQEILFRVVQSYSGVLLAAKHMLARVNCKNCHNILLVVVHDLHICPTRRPCRPLEADPPFVVDANAVLTLSVALQGLGSVAG